MADRVGDDRIVPTLHRVSTPWKLPRDVALQDVIIKCTHASGAMIVCGTPQTPSFGGLKRRLGCWLALDYGTALHEWGYAQADRSIIVEPVLRDRRGSYPRDAKFHMHDGELLVVQCSGGDVVLSHEKVGHETTSFLTPDWELADIRRRADTPNTSNPVPAGLDEMKAIAADSSKGIDYVRVDFLLLDDTFYIGELTMYASSGLKPCETYEMEKWPGDAWTLPSL